MKTAVEEFQNRVLKTIDHLNGVARSIKIKSMNCNSSADTELSAVKRMHTNCRQKSGASRHTNLKTQDDDDRKYNNPHYNKVIYIYAIIQMFMYIYKYYVCLCIYTI